MNSFELDILHALQAALKMGRPRKYDSDVERLAAEAELKRIKRANESQEARSKRLRRMAAYERERRANESVSAKKERLAKIAQAQKNRRNIKAKSSKGHRLIKIALVQKHRRAAESNSARREFSAKISLASRIYHSSETSEQKRVGFSCLDETDSEATISVTTETAMREAIDDHSPEQYVSSSALNLVKNSDFVKENKSFADEVFGRKPSFIAPL